ncbi:MAG: hypothetical protein FJ144_02810 [Deltaproteobacteria bacterium]|nr:hypothetical protein [Deltaproteobacteria bacterium]
MKEAGRVDILSWNPSVKRLPPDEIAAIVERALAAPFVDPVQVPLNQPAVRDSPELRLNRAILFDAIQCAIRHLDSGSEAMRAEARMALRWIDGDDESYFLSFIPICHRLGVDPEWIRRLVHTRLPAEHPAGRVAEAA